MIRYKTGNKDGMVAKLFATRGDYDGVYVNLPSIGLSRRYTGPQVFPLVTQYVSGREAMGYTFVKYELI